MDDAVRVVAAALLIWCGVSGQTNDDEATLGFLSANSAVHRGRLQELSYYEGMPVNFTCAVNNWSNSSASLQISYFSKDLDAVSTGFQQRVSVYMYFKLISTNNDTFLTCTIKDDSKNDSNIIQLRLLLRNVPYNEGFEVNGLLVAPRADVGSAYLKYEYHYIWEEYMTVRLVKGSHEFSYTRCRVSGYNFPGPWLDHVNAKETLSSSIGVHLVNTSLLMQQSGTIITCYLKRSAATLAATVEGSRDLVLEIKFIYYDLVPFMGGLSMASVLLLYRDTTANVTLLSYDNDMSYTGNGTHYLTCNPDGPATTSMWVFIPSQISFSDATYPNSFRLNDDVKASFIKCLRTSHDASIPHRAVQMVLRRLEPPSPTVQPLSDHNREETARWVLPAAVAAPLLTLVCVALVVTVVWRWRRARDASFSDSNWSELHPPRHSCNVDEEPQYEVIPEFPVVLEVPTDIAQRPPQPLPAGVSEENGGRYRHYDTPYEWRIFRFGVRRCACGRCSVSG